MAKSGGGDAISFAQQLARIPEERLGEIFAGLSSSQVASMRRHWPFWTRGNQKQPLGAWRIWLILAGRGYGKTRAGAEWVRAFAGRFGDTHIALVGATMAEARAVMVEGESGLLAITRGEERPTWEPSLHRLRWPNGAVASLYSAADPESLRGPAHHLAWADEIAKWDVKKRGGGSAWDNLILGLRRGDYPRAMATTTPRPTPLLRRMLADPAVIVTRGTTRDNLPNLGRGFVAEVEKAYGGTRLGRQEIGGELIEDIEGSLWPRALLAACRVAATMGASDLTRIVIGVDPPASSGGDACGIIVAGLGTDGRGYVIDDASVEGMRPEGWARAVAAAAARWDADRVVAEANQGGDMVRSVLEAVETRLPLRLVHARRGKIARAEPVAALYEKDRVRHAGRFAALEDEMAGMVIGGGYAGPGRSPDRADALVWALTELLLSKRGRPGVRGL